MFLVESMPFQSYHKSFDELKWTEIVSLPGKVREFPFMVNTRVHCQRANSTLSHQHKFDKFQIEAPVNTLDSMSSFPAWRRNTRNSKIDTH
jgi:hypothetical protein